MEKPVTNNKNKSAINGQPLTEEDRLRKDIYRPDMEKLHLFTQMLRINNLFKKARVTHK
jgi:hypothetical protein